MAYHTNDNRRIAENLRVMLAIVAGMLMLDEQSSMHLFLLLATLAFSIYAAILLWQAANKPFNTQNRGFYWIDACWFLLFLFLAQDSASHYLPFLLFPVFLTAWSSSYRESVAIAAFSGFGSLIVLALNNLSLPWQNILAIPLALFVIALFFVYLARILEARQKKLDLAQRIVVSTDPRLGFDAIVSELMTQIAGKLNSSVALLALRTYSGTHRVICCEEKHKAFELSGEAATQLANQALALPTNKAVGWSSACSWWQRDLHIELNDAGDPDNATPVSRETLLSLAHLTGKGGLLSAPIAANSIGQMRLILAGDSVEISVQSLRLLQHLITQFGSSVENASLREELANQAADTERARIGRDLHDSAIQPYIGLKFAIEAVQRRAGPDNPVAPDLARLTEMIMEELATMREVISGLRGDPGQGGTLLSNAVKRHAARCGQLFGIDVEIDIEEDMPVNRRMAGELFHMVAEGLSNIGRHTQSRWAQVSLNMQNGDLVLQMRNKNDKKKYDAAVFTPLSLTERAADLGGTIGIQRDEKLTTVTIKVPVSAHKNKIERHVKDGRQN